MSSLLNCRYPIRTVPSLSIANIWERPWSRDSPYDDDGWRWVELAFDGERTHLLLARRQYDRPSDKPVIVLIDNAVEDIIRRLKNTGVEIITEPRKALWNPSPTFAEFRDSEGNRMVLSSQ